MEIDLLFGEDVLVNINLNSKNEYQDFSKNRIWLQYNSIESGSYWNKLMEIKSLGTAGNIRPGRQRGAWWCLWREEATGGRGTDPLGRLWPLPGTELSGSIPSDARWAGREGLPVESQQLTPHWSVSHFVHGQLSMPNVWIDQCHAHLPHRRMPMWQNWFTGATGMLKFGLLFLPAWFWGIISAGTFFYIDVATREKHRWSLNRGGTFGSGSLTQAAGNQLKPQMSLALV